MDILFSVVSAGYALAVLILLYGWARAIETSPPASTSARFISIVIPFRNEATHLPLLIGDLKNLSYPPGRWEAVFVDDHSDDHFYRVAADLKSPDGNIKIVKLSDRVGKKNAIARGIEETQGDIVVTTDADCRIPADWLQHINKYFEDDSTRMVVGVVVITENRGFFSRLQALEWCSLTGATGATIALGLPLLCSGANLAFRRKSFLEAGGYSGNERVSSGDDQYLLHKFTRRWPGSVRFNSTKEAAVRTASCASVTGFLQQRLRWAGKWRSGTPLFLRAVAAGAWLFHFFFLISVPALLLKGLHAPVLYFMILSRVFVEALFLFPVTEFSRVRWRWTSFVFLQVAYPVYVFAVGLLSLLIKARWKGRIVAAGV